jgi:hypothetical protein
MRTFLVFAAALLNAALLAQSSTYQRDQIVRLMPKLQADAGGIRDVRVVAIAGDRIHVDANVITVNGTAVAGLNPEFTNSMRRDRQVLDATVPDGHVVVVGELNERRTGSIHAGRYWAITPTENVTSAIQ